MRRDLEQGRDLETLAIPLGGLRPSRLFPRTGPVPVLARDSSFYAEIFASRSGHVLRPRAGAMGTVYAVVDTISALGPKEYAEHRNELREELFERHTAAWTDRLRARATIRVYRNDLHL